MGVPTIPKKYIRSLNINGLDGRVLELPKPTDRSSELLLIYGHHTSLERMYSIAKSLNKDVGIVMPDLPGFGGMTPLYKIGREPSIDELADYLAAYIKLRFNGRKRFSLGAMSYGFVVATRMLQKYPDIAARVDNYVGIAGFSSYKDFKFKRRNFYFLKSLGWVFQRRLPAGFVKTFLLRAPVIRATYKVMDNRIVKMQGFDSEARRDLVTFEINLWQSNDFRTYARTGYSFFVLDLTHKKLDIPLELIQIDADQYFDNERLLANLKKIFPKVTVHKAQLKAHMPTLIDEGADSDDLVPESAREILRRL